MKRRLGKFLCVTAVASMCILPFGMTAQAAEKESSTEMAVTTPAKNTVVDKWKDMKENLHNKINKNIGNLVNIHIGDVGSVDVGTSDDVDVNLNNVPININININFGNIIIGGNRN